MKRTIQCVLLSLIIMPCFSQGIVMVDIINFKKEGESLQISYKVKSDASTVASGQGLSITLLIEAGDSLLYLPHIAILGSNKSKVIARYQNNSGTKDRIITMKSGEEQIYNTSIPYRKWMDSAHLSVLQEVSGYRGHNLITYYRLKDSVELESSASTQPICPHTVATIPPKEEKRCSYQGKASLGFPVGSSVIQPTYKYNKQDLMKIDNAISDIITNKNATILGLYIEGYASPEGSSIKNERLSLERALALKNYIKDKFSIDETLFEVTAMGEDWDGLEMLVKASNLPEKEEILNIISTTNIEDGREAALMKIDNGDPYRSMSDNIFPMLRRVKYRIDYSVKGNSCKEASLNK